MSGRVGELRLHLAYRGAGELRRHQADVADGRVDKVRHRVPVATGRVRNGDGGIAEIKVEGAGDALLHKLTRGNNTFTDPADGARKTKVHSERRDHLPETDGIRHGYLPPLRRSS